MRRRLLPVAVAVVLAAGLLGLVAFMRQSRSEPPLPPAPSVKKPPLEEAPPPADPVPGPPVDLLALVDLQADAIGGIWGRDGGALRTPSSPFGRLQLPYFPPRDYDLKVVVERVGGKDSLNLGLAQGERQFQVIIDGKGGEFGGLDMVDRKPFFENMTTFRQRMLPEGERRTVLCSVRRWGVRVSVENQKVVDWRGSYASLSLFSDWQIPERQGLFVGSFSSEFKVHSVELIPFGEGGSRLR